jgi:molybdopterin-guanine dinucleotide biosynthesis protein A
MPLVTPEAIDALVDHLVDGVDAVVPVVDGHDQPLHALYRPEAVMRVAAGLEGRGPRALLDRLDTVVGVPADEVDAPLASAVTNVNTREQLEAVRRRMNATGSDATARTDDTQ